MNSAPKVSQSSVVSTPIQVLCSGIFADEKVLQFLTILQTLSDNCFGKIHEIVSPQHNPDDPEYGNLFRTCLNSIEYWPSKVRIAEANAAVEQYPEMGILYQYTIVRYLKELFCHDAPRQIPVSIPPLHDFIHQYYVTLSKSSYMQKLEFLRIYGLERTHMHMEALRKVLMDVTRHSIYTMSTSSLEPYSLPGVMSVENDVSPWDSISQVGDRNSHVDKPRSVSHSQPEPQYQSEFRKPIQGGSYHRGSHSQTQTQTQTQPQSHSQSYSQSYSQPRTQPQPPTQPHSQEHSDSPSDTIDIDMDSVARHENDENDSDQSDASSGSAEN